jgi:hypothetical protein
MIVETHNNFKDPLKLTASRVLISDEFGNPVCFVVQFAPGHIVACHAGDPNFEDQLHMHGFDQTVIVKRLDNKKLAKPHILLG